MLYTIAEIITSSKHVWSLRSVDATLVEVDLYILSSQLLL